MLSFQLFYSVGLSISLLLYSGRTRRGCPHLTALAMSSQALVSARSKILALFWCDDTGVNAQIVGASRGALHATLGKGLCCKLLGQWHVQCCALQHETCWFQGQLRGTHHGQACACAVDATIAFLSVCQALNKQTLLKQIRCNFQSVQSGFLAMPAKRNAWIFDLRSLFCCSFCRMKTTIYPP